MSKGIAYLGVSTIFSQALTPEEFQNSIRMMQPKKGLHNLNKLTGSALRQAKWHILQRLKNNAS